jgi:4-hydroxyphenylpyruvate dioxygenase
VERRIPGHGEDLAALRELKILIDGAPTAGQGCCCRSSPRT